MTRSAFVAVALFTMVESRGHAAHAAGLDVGGTPAVPEDCGALYEGKGQRRDFAKALAPGGTIILAGLLDTQAEAVARAYEAQNMKLHEKGAGEWPVLVLKGSCQE